MNVHVSVDFCFLTKRLSVHPEASGPGVPPSTEYLEVDRLRSARHPSIIDIRISISKQAIFSVVPPPPPQGLCRIDEGEEIWQDCSTRLFRGKMPGLLTHQLKNTLQKPGGSTGKTLQRHLWDLAACLSR